MTDDELRRLALAATPGPWRIDATGRITAPHAYGPDDPGTVLFDEWLREGDADGRYIAAVSPDVVLGLLDRLRMRSCQHEACTDVYDSDSAASEPIVALAWALAELSADGPHGSNERRRFRPLARNFLRVLKRDPKRLAAVRQALSEPSSPADSLLPPHTHFDERDQTPETLAAE